MDRMLSALKRIESRNPQSPLAAQQDTAGGADLAGVESMPQETGTATTAAPEPAPCEDSSPMRDSAAMEALLVEAETATEEALRDATADRTDRDDLHEPAQPTAKPRSAGETHQEEGALPDPLGDLAASVLHAMTPGQPTSFLFTSPDSDSLAIDLLVPLSMSLARRLDSGLLLIDTNLRRPALAARLGVEASRGLTDVLSGSARWQDVVRRTVVPGVDLLPAVAFSTPAGPPPGRLNLERLLCETRDRYRLILIHASSLQYPEVAPLARHCEGVYLVVRLHATTRRTAMEAAPLLQRAGANLLGCIVVQ